MAVEVVAAGEDTVAVAGTEGAGAQAHLGTTAPMARVPLGMANEVATVKMAGLEGLVALEVTAGTPEMLAEADTRAREAV